MKFSKIIKFAAAALGVTALMNVSAFAATTISTGEIENKNAYISVPIFVESTDYDNVAGVEFTLQFDSSKYTFYDASDVTASVWDEMEEEYVSKTVGMKTVNGNSKGEYISWVAGGDGSVTLDENGRFQLFTVRLRKNVSGSVPSDSDYSIVDAKTVLTIDSTNKQQVVDTSEFGTFVIYKFPKEVGSDWKDGYIQKLEAVIKENGTTLATQQIMNYYEDGDDYAFVLKLVPSEKKTVDIDIQASLSSKKDSPSTEWTTKVIDTISSVTAEKLQ